MNNMFLYSNLSTTNYDAILTQWSQLETLQSNVKVGAVGITYCNSEAARQHLTDTYNWTIIDYGIDSNCSALSIDDLDTLEISIYPNPASEDIFIKGNYTQLNAVLYDILGKEVMTKEVTNASIKNNISIAHLKNGIYLLLLSDGINQITQKIVKY